MSRYPTLHIFTALENPFRLLQDPLVAQMEALSFEGFNRDEVILPCLKELCLGDELAAEYVLLNLISRVHTRDDGVPLGTANINLYTKDKEAADSIAENLKNMIEAITTHTLHMPVTCEAIASVPFIPVKDYEKNKLVRGAFQMPNGT